MTYIHTAGDRSPFTYVIKFPSTGQFYYGVRYAKGCKPEDLGKTYFSSSNTVLSRLKFEQNPIFEVRKIFNCIDQAKQHETKFLQRVDARHNPKLLNRHNNDGCYPVDNRGPKNPAYGKPGTRLGAITSDETKVKISQALSGDKNGFFNKHHSSSMKHHLSTCQQGSKHRSFKGYYHTPYGIFESCRLASTSEISKSTIKTWCYQCDKVITTKTSHAFIKPHHVGKTFREIGFWFEPAP